MDPDNVVFKSNSYLNGTIASSKEFTVSLEKKNHLAITSPVIGAILLYLFLNSENENWQKCLYFLLLIIYVALIILKFLFTVKEETVLLIVPIAMQLTTSYLSGCQTIHSIPWYRLKDLMILDIIVGQQVLCFLAVDVKSDTDSGSTHVILFRHAKPRLKYLERVYRELQEILDKNR